MVVGLRGIPNVQGGVETHAEQLYPRIAKQGHDVFIFGRKRFLNTDSSFLFSGCTILPTHHLRSIHLETPFHTLSSIWKARKLKPDILHIHAIGPSLFTPIARLLGMKVVVTHHGMDYRRQKWGRLARIALWTGEYFAAKFANSVISISSAITERIHCISPGQKVYQISNGVPLPDLAPKNSCDEFKALGLESVRYIFALGRFVPEKRFHTLIEAWKLLPEGTCKLVIAGDADHPSPYSKALKEQARLAGAILTGFVKGEILDDLFRNAAGFVIPSSHEGLPIALLEAMSYNLPVIASDIAPHLEVGLPEECYFPLDAIDPLGLRILSLLSGTHHQNHREKLAATYDWDIIARRTEEVYQNVLR